MTAPSRPQAQTTTKPAPTTETPILDKIIEQTDKLRKELEPIRGMLHDSAPKWFDVNRIYAGLDAAIAKDANVLKADRKSLYIALNKVARWGLDIGDGVDLVVMNRNTGTRQTPNWIKTVEAWADYKGLKALAIRQGLIRSAEEFIIWEGEKYEVCQGSEPMLRHWPIRSSNPRAILGAYSRINLPYGRTTFNLLFIEQIEETRAKSKSWSDTALADKKQQTGCPPWYAKKSAIRDWLNRQPKTGALGEALEAENIDLSGLPDPAAAPAETARPPHVTGDGEDLRDGQGAGTGSATGESHDDLPF